MSLEWFIGNVVIISKINIGKIWGKLLQRNLLNFKDPLGFSETVFFQKPIYKDDLVNFLKIKLTIKQFSRGNLQRFFVNNNTTFISGKFLHKNKY